MQTLETIRELWCEVMHDSPMWPIHGHYDCRTCGRRYTVPWTEERQMLTPAARSSHVQRARVPSALLPLAVVLALLAALPAWAADNGVVDSAGGAGLAFARYNAGLEHTNPWTLEVVEIQACLPETNKAGRLRAVRHLLPVGKPEYQVLESEGDRTVRQQVIVRYLSADVAAAAIPASSVAITPQNYQFRYKGTTSDDGPPVYVFQITPRKKRDGLIKGELWLDGETGSVVRQSGYLVKGPSIFVRRVEVTRETVLRDGIAAARVTRIWVHTRLVGPAQLTIWERPLPASDQPADLAIEERQ